MTQDTSQPVPQSKRLEVLDILRGFALLGILLANTGNYSLYQMQPSGIKARFPYPKINEFLDVFHYFLVTFWNWVFTDLLSKRVGRTTQLVLPPIVLPSGYRTHTRSSHLGRRHISILRLGGCAPAAVPQHGAAKIDFGGGLAHDLASAI
jgi:uncharacterized membrane protein YeiB